MALQQGYGLSQQALRQVGETVRAVRAMRQYEGQKGRPEPANTARHHMWVQATDTALDGTAEAYPAKLVLHDVAGNSWDDFTVVWLRLANGATPDETTLYWCPLEGFHPSDGVAVFVFGDQAGGTEEGARVYNSSPVTLTHTTPTAIPFDSDRFNSGGAYHHTVTNNTRLKVPADGTYRCGAGITIEDAGSGVDLYLLLRLRLNGTVTIGQNQGYTEASLVADLSVQVASGDYELSAGNYVEVYAEQYNGASSNLDVQVFGDYSPEAWIKKVG